MGNLTLKELGRRAFETAKAKGFHDEPIDIPRALMLTVSPRRWKPIVRTNGPTYRLFSIRNPVKSFRSVKSSRYTLKTRSRTSWPTRLFACLIYPPHSASISKCTFC